MERKDHILAFANLWVSGDKEEFAPDLMRYLDQGKGAISFLVYEEENLIGHAALDKAADPETRMVRFLFIAPEHRSRGAGQRMIALLENYARNRLGAKRLELKVRSFNGRAMRCYEKCGFTEFLRKDTLVMMGRDI